MVASRKAADPHVNRLLSLLPPRDYERLHLQDIPLKYTSPSDLSISSRLVSAPW
jgi:hypothetical protein